MKIIAHRGNLEGPNKSTENKPETICSAIERGFDCEIDVWRIDDQLWLGHDEPQYVTSLSFLTHYHTRLWIHCKNLEALTYLKDDFNCFFHDKDVYTLTSRGYIWGNISSPCNSFVIQVMPELTETFSTQCYGVCTDYPIRYASILV
jgi:hypothetical protein